LKIGYSKVFKHPKAKTLYIIIPSHVASDSLCSIKEGDIVSVMNCVDVENEARGRGIFIALQDSKQK